MTQGVTAVDRALSIICAFGPNDDTLSLQELATRTGLNKSTIIRLIASLEHQSFMLRKGQGVYALGPALLKYGSRYQASLRLSDYVVPALTKLMKETGQTAAFFVRDGDTRVCLHMVDSYSVLRSHLRVGSVQPILPSGSGRILLAYSDNAEEAEQYAAVRKKPCVVNRGERHPEIFSVAAPVFGAYDKLVGAITVSGPTADYTRTKVTQLKTPLMHIAMELSNQLGGTFHHAKL